MIVISCSLTCGRYGNSHPERRCRKLISFGRRIFSFSISFHEHIKKRHGVSKLVHLEIIYRGDFLLEYFGFLDVFFTYNSKRTNLTFLLDSHEVRNFVCCMKSSIFKILVRVRHIMIAPGGGGGRSPPPLPLARVFLFGRK